MNFTHEKPGNKYTPPKNLEEIISRVVTLHSKMKFFDTEEKDYNEILVKRAKQRGYYK